MMEVKNIQTDRGTIACRVGGNGKPVLLLHGFGETGDIWHSLATHLLPFYQLWIPDLPGSGGSAGTAPGNIDDMAAAIYQLIESESIDNLSLIGHSMGGYIALALAEKYPEKLCCYGLFHSTAFADTTEKIAARKKSIEFILEYGPEAFLKQMIPNLFAENFVLAQRPVVDAQMEKSRHFSGETLIAYYEAMMARPDRTRVLVESGLPVLFILGEKDNAAPLPDLLKQSFLPDLSYIHVLENVAHMGMLEAPERCHNIVTDFLEFIHG
jgi:pimeloyl-ACP methyl ester carboxylesterase